MLPSDLQQQLEAAFLGSSSFLITSFVSLRQQLPQKAQAWLGKKGMGLEGKRLMENEEGGREGGRKGGRGELSEAPRGRDFRTHSRWGLPSSLAAAFLSGTVKEAGCGHHPHFPRGPSFCLAFQLGPVIFRRKHLKMLQVYLLFSFNLFLLPVAHASS
jgi:hypothetical protein